MLVMSKQLCMSYIYQSDKGELGRIGAGTDLIHLFYSPKPVGDCTILSIPVDAQICEMFRCSTRSAPGAGILTLKHGTT